MKLLIWAVLVSLGLFDSHQLWSIWSQVFHDEHQCYERKRKKQIYNVEALGKRSDTSKPSQFTIHCFTSDDMCHLRTSNEWSRAVFTARM